MSDDNEASLERPLVSIIVVTYNTCELTLECLRSVRSQTSVPCDLIVIENASQCGSAEMIADQFPDIQLLVETANHGFA